MRTKSLSKSAIKTTPNKSPLQYRAKSASNKKRNRTPSTRKKSLARSGASFRHFSPARSLGTSFASPERHSSAKRRDFSASKSTLPAELERPRGAPMGSRFSDEAGLVDVLKR